MTYSIGFRAPSRGELIGGWAESLLTELDDDDRYADPDLAAQENPGEITPEAIDRLHGMVTERMLDRGAFARWFAQYSTTPKNPEIDWRLEEPIGIEDLRAPLADGMPLLRNPASRFSFIREQAGSLLLFVDGQRFLCAGEAASFAERICAQDRLMVDRAMVASGPALELIAELFNQGSVAFDQQG